MKEEDIIRTLIGWKCPCCRTVWSPSQTSCLWCSPVIYAEMQQKSPGADLFQHNCVARSTE